MIGYAYPLSKDLSRSTLEELAANYTTTII